MACSRCVTAAKAKFLGRGAKSLPDTLQRGRYSLVCSAGASGQHSSRLSVTVACNSRYDDADNVPQSVFEWSACGGLSVACLCEHCVMHGLVG